MNKVYTQYIRTSCICHVLEQMVVQLITPPTFRNACPVGMQWTFYRIDLFPHS